MMTKYRVTVHVQNPIVYEIEANDEDHASQLIHEDINRYEDKIISEDVSDWDVDPFVMEVEE